MLIPLSCDAPIYHWPYATIGLIVVNIAALVAVPVLLTGSPDEVQATASWLVLEHGNGLHPVQWLTSMFMHAGILHLLGNMLFLWIFGLVVEGKVGWWRFLLIYLGIGVLQSAVEQVSMLGLAEPSYSLGASSAIYGAMAVAFIWAPKNEINCFYWFAIWAMGTIDVPIMVFALIYIAFDVLYMGVDVASTGSLMGTGFLHVTGALIGIPVGLIMLKANLVDCEGWDLLHVWNGANPGADSDYAKIDAEVESKKQAKQTSHLEAAKAQFDGYLADGNIRAAVTLHEKMRQVGQGLQLSHDELLAVIRGLHQRQEWAASAPFMQELVNRFSEGSDGVRIKLAQICVTELQKPARAVELLNQVDFTKQPEQKRVLAKKIARRAKQMQDEGVYELDDESL